jgi:anti-anti-sigma factor
MPANSFSASVRHETGSNIIDLRGEINAFAEKDLNAAYAEAQNGDASTILLNFGAVDYINSTGIALIVGLLAQARKSRRKLRVYGLSEHYLEIFQITRLADFMDICQDEQNALAPAAPITAK